MSTSNLAILIFVATVTLFATSIFARRPGRQSKMLNYFMTGLGIAIVILTLIYFKTRFMA